MRIIVNPVMVMVTEIFLFVLEIPRSDSSIPAIIVVVAMVVMMGIGFPFKMWEP